MPENDIHSQVFTPAMRGDSGQPSQTPPEPGPAKSGAKKTIISLVAVVVLAGAAWAAYAAYYSPGRVWQKFSTTAQIPKIATESFNFSYLDNGKATGAALSNPAIPLFTNVKVSLNGTAYFNNTDLAHPKASMDMSYSFGSGNTSVSSAAKLILLDQDIYVNLGDNPFINSMLSYLSPDKKIEWIKINGKEIQEASGATSTAQTDYAQQAKLYQDIVSKHMPKIVTLDKYLGKETLHGVTTLHYSNKMDKTELKAMVHELLDAVVTQAQADSPQKPEDLAKVKEILGKVADNFSDRLQIGNLETWVGMQDAQLYKVKFSSNAPSFVSLISLTSDPNIVNETDPDKITDSVLKTLTFDAQVNVSEEYYDFGKTQEVKVPDNAFDLAKKIKEQLQPTPLPFPMQ